MDNRRRTESAQGWNDGVRIREVGAPAGNGYSSSGDTFPPEAGVTHGHNARPQRRNSPFLAAWIFTGLLIGVGFLWIGGVLDDGSTSNFGYTVSIDPATGLPVGQESRPLEVQLRNIGYVAPFMLLIGLASAAALLALQGVRKGQILPSPSSELDVHPR